MSAVEPTSTGTDWNPVIDRFLELDDADRRTALGRMNDATRAELIKAVQVRASQPKGFSDSRTATQVAKDQVVENVKGIPQLITSIPGMLSTMFDLGKAAITGDAKTAMEKTGEIVEGVTTPLTTIAKGAMAAKIPGPIDATVAEVAGFPQRAFGIEPHDPRLVTTGEDWKQAANATGANLAGELLGVGAVKGGQAVKANRAAKAGNIAVSKAEFPAAYAPWADELGQAFNAKSSEAAFIDLTSNADVAMKEIKQSASKIYKAPIQTNRQQIIAGKDAMERIYSQDVKPLVEMVGEVDGAPLAAELKSRIPNSFTAKERAAMERQIDAEVGRTMTGPQLEKLRQKLRAADRVNLALNSYERAAVEKLPQGWVLGELNNGVRNLLADEVLRVQPGRDIRPALQRYGAVTDVVQQAGGIPVDPGVFELIAGRGHGYVTGTQANLTGRVAQLVTSKWTASDNLVKRAYAKYTGPVTPPAPPPLNPATITGQQGDLIPNAEGSATPGIPPVDNSVFRVDWNDSPLFGSPRGGMLEGQKIPQTPESGASKAQRVNTERAEAIQRTASTKALPPSSAPGPVQGPSKPATFSMRAGDIPKELLKDIEVVNAEHIRKVDQVFSGERAGPELPGSDPRLPAHYRRENWQYSGESNRGPQKITTGVLQTQDPAIVRNTIQSIQRYVIEHKIRGKQLTELKRIQHDLIQQLNRAEKGSK